MAEQQGVWGIDVGQCALKALRLELIDDQVTATAFDYIEHPKLLNQPDADPDQLTREALEKFLSRNSIRGDLVAMSVPGQSGLARFVKLPPVEEKKIVDIVKFEAKQQIPFNLNEVVWDYQKIGSGVVTDGFAMETEIGLFAIKRDMVNKYLRHFQEVDIEVHIVQMTPLALCNFVSYDLLGKTNADAEEGGGKKECVAGLDIATDNANLVITDGERIIWQRPIPIGGNHFTRALTKDLKLTFAKAEHLKRNATKSPDLKKILLSLKPVLNDFMNEVSRSLGFFINTHREANIQYLVGLGSAFRLPGLQKFLAEKLQVEVRKLQKFERLAGDSVITAPVFTENVLSFAPAYGLALQGLKLPRVQTNLLPQDIQVERLIRSKKPMAVTAAAALLIGTAMLTFGYAREHRAVAAPIIGKARDQAKAIIDEADRKSQQRKGQLKKIDELETAVKSVLAGQDERENWVQLNKFINDRLPRPDGANLTVAQKEKYWLTPTNADVKGASAWKTFQARKAGGKGVDNEDIIEHLVQINVEGIDCLSFKDLKPVFSSFLAKKPNPVGMPVDEAKAPPEGEGWLVEVRGYTYHQERIQFVIDTLVRNMIDKPFVVEPKKEGKPKEKVESEPELIEKPKEMPNRISHPFIYAYEAVANPDPIPNKVINKNAIRKMVLLMSPVQENTAAATEQVEAAAMAAAFGPRGGWHPLGGTGPAEDKGTLAIAGEPTDKPPAEGEARPAHTRTEFILVFVWKEPTPSDQLRPKVEGTPGESGADGKLGK